MKWCCVFKNQRIFVRMLVEGHFYELDVTLFQTWLLCFLLLNFRVCSYIHWKVLLWRDKRMTYQWANLPAIKVSFTFFKDFDIIFSCILVINKNVPNSTCVVVLSLWVRSKQLQEQSICIYYVENHCFKYYLKIHSSK